MSQAEIKALRYNLMQAGWAVNDSGATKPSQPAARIMAETLNQSINFFMTL